jgi:hypothetical protein
VTVDWLTAGNCKPFQRTQQHRDNESALTNKTVLLTQLTSYKLIKILDTKPRFTEIADLSRRAENREMIGCKQCLYLANLYINEIIIDRLENARSGSSAV